MPRSRGPVNIARFAKAADVANFPSPATTAAPITAEAKSYYYCVFTSERRAGPAILLASTVVAHGDWLGISGTGEATREDVPFAELIPASVSVEYITD